MLYALYLLLLSRAGSFAEVLWLQGLNAVATAALMAIPISYMQEAIRGRVGLSTSLLDVVGVASGLLAAGIFALATAGGGYQPALVAAALLAAAGATVVLVAHARPRRRLAAD